MTSIPARPSAAGRAGFVVAATALVATLAAVVRVTAHDAWALPAARELPVDAAVGIAYGAAAALVLAGTGGRRIGWLLLGIGVAGAGTTGATALALVATQPSSLATTAVFVQSWLWVPSFLPLVTVLPLLYPDGRLPARRWWPVLAAATGGMVLAAAGSALYPETFEGRVPLSKPWTDQGTSQTLFVASFVLLVPACVAALAAVFLRWRGSDGLVRRQVVVLLMAAGLLVLDIAVQPLLDWPVGALTQAAAVALVPAAIGVAVTRHRLYDLDLAVCRAIAGVSLAACLAGSYVTLFFLASAVLPGGTTVSAAAAAGACGLLSAPLGAQLTRGVDRLFYGDRGDPGRVLASVATGLSEGMDLVDVPAQVCTVVVDSLRLSSAALVLGDAGAGAPAAAVGSPVGPVIDLPMRHRGDVVGALRVTARPGETRLSRRDAELLSVVCDQVAPAVAALLLSHRLQASRAALVTAREEERRRLRRDLHDGLGAALAGVRLQVETARDLVPDHVVGGLLSTAAGGVATAVDDLRGITEDLRPPALDDLGLEAVLRGLAERLSTPRVPVSVDVDADETLPAAVEVACYRIAAEALTNAVRHAGARQISLCLTGLPGRLSLRVADDGSGLPDRRRPGALGLQSIRQRAEEIGGTLRIVSDSRGTLVHAELPTEPR
ncbi:MAG TPA: histidine kinase [Nocardioidaceae bacterium]|nr:histidine kinase [Nocardioidaceae bacterium]